MIWHTGTDTCGQLRNTYELDRKKGSKTEVSVWKCNQDTGNQKSSSKLVKNMKQLEGQKEKINHNKYMGGTAMIKAQIKCKNVANVVG